MTKQADLIAYIFEGLLPHRGDAAQLAVELFAWMDGSARFTGFVETYRDKIRKKIRTTRDPESVLDLHGELEVAYRLLNDRRLTAAYEPYASAKRRGPDFSVTYRTNLVFNVEVARIRVETNRVDEINLARKEERVVRIVLDKLGQMQPAMPNLLVIHTRVELAGALDLNRIMQALKTRAEGKDPGFYALSRYATPADFYKDFLRLSAILLWAAVPDAPTLWVNKQARPGLAENILRLISSLPAGTDSESAS